MEFLQLHRFTANPNVINMYKRIFVIVFLGFIVAPAYCRKRHVISFHSPNLYPDSFAWDPKSDHFIVGSLRQRHLISVSDAGVVSNLLSDDSLPFNSSFVGISLDPRRHRLLAVVRRHSPPFSALASYDLPTFRRLFLSPLDDLLPSPIFANDVAADYSGNAYVTDSANDVVFKVSEQGDATILSRSKAFRSENKIFGLNGVAYNPKGYLLVTQSNTGKLFNVNVDEGTARQVILNRELTAASGIAVRKDGVVLVVSKHKLYYIKSADSWSEGVVFDETALEEEEHASAVAVGAEDRAYVLYGHIDEAITGNSERDEFSIVEVESEVEAKGENVWIFVLIGLGFAYFLFWRFQMRKLVQNMNKKTA